MNDDKLNNIREFIDIKCEKIFGCFVFILLPNVLFYIAIEMGKEVGVNFVISKIKNLTYCFFHLLDV